MAARMNTRSNSAAPTFKVALEAEPRSKSKTNRTVASKVSKNGLKGKAVPAVVDTSDDEVPLSKIKGSKAKAAPKASAKLKVLSTSKMADVTFILPKDIDVELPVEMSDQPDVSKASKTKPKSSKKAKGDSNSNFNEDPTTAVRPSRKPKSAAISVSNPQLDETVVLSKPTSPKIPKRGKKVKQPISSDDESVETGAPSESQVLKPAPAKNPTKKGNKKKLPLGEDPESMEEPIGALPVDEGMDSELSDEPPKRGRKNKPATLLSTGTAETLPDSATTRQVNRGNQNMNIAVENSEGVQEGLPDLLNQLDLNDDQGAKKVGRKKTVPRGKAKSAVRKTQKVKDADSDPEMTLKKYSSIENMNNVTVQRGTNTKSMSVDNLHALSSAQLDEPRPIRAHKLALSNAARSMFSDSNSEEEKKTKKARAPKKKTTK